jgi:hypothetical protein
LPKVGFNRCGIDINFRRLRFSASGNGGGWAGWRFYSFHTRESYGRDTGQHRTPTQLNE